MREELRRRRKNSKFHRWLIPGVLLLLILVFVGLAVNTINHEKKLEAQYSRAELLLQEQDYERAAALFQELYEKHPSFHLAPRALFQAGETLNLFLRRYHEALLAYLLVERDYPGTEIARRSQQQIAEIYKTRLRDYNRAIVAYQRLLDSGVPGGDAFQYEVADAYFRLSNFEQARIEFEALLKNYPSSPFVPEVMYRLGVTHSLEGSLRQAEGAFRTMLGNWPDHVYAIEAQFGLATVLEEREELLAALKILQELEGIYPNAEALAKKTEQVRERIRKKKKAI